MFVKLWVLVYFKVQSIYISISHLSTYFTIYLAFYLSRYSIYPTFYTLKCLDFLFLLSIQLSWYLIIYVFRFHGRVQTRARIISVMSCPSRSGFSWSSSRNYFKFCDFFYQISSIWEVKLVTTYIPFFYPYSNNELSKYLIYCQLYYRVKTINHL